MISNLVHQHQLAFSGWGFPLIISMPILASVEDREAGYVEVTKEFWDRQSHTALKLKKKGKETLRKYRRNVKQLTDKLSE